MEGRGKRRNILRLISFVMPARSHQGQSMTPWRVSAEQHEPSNRKAQVGAEITLRRGFSSYLTES